MAIIIIYFCLPFSPQFRGIQLVVSLVIAATPVWTRERRRSRAVHPPIHNPTKLHCFLAQCPLNLEACRTNVSEEKHCTPGDCQRALCPACHRNLLVHDGTRISLVAKRSLNADDAGPIVCRTILLPIVMPFMCCHHLMFQNANVLPQVARICTQFLKA